jgi:hypothetical protein
VTAVDIRARPAGALAREAHLAAAERTARGTRAHELAVLYVMGKGLMTAVRGVAVHSRERKLREVAPFLSGTVRAR